MIEGVIFDLWNTLVSARGPRFTARLAALVDISEKTVRDYLRATGCLRKEVVPEDLARDLWLQEKEADPPSEFLEHVRTARREFVESVTFLDGAPEAIACLLGAGLKVGVVSNATSISLEVVKNVGLTERISDVCISCVTGHLKPDPLALTKVTEKWKIAPTAVCMVGDKIKTDVFAARLCGMQCVLYRPKLAQTHVRVSSSILAVVRELEHVPDIVLNCATTSK